MVSLTEAIAQQSPLESALRTGIENISSDQQIAFNQYRRQVLPADGYIFWVSTGSSITVTGSLHYSVDESQDETETTAVNRIIFTSEQEVQAFNSVAPDMLWIGALGSAVGSAGNIVEGIADLTPFPVMFAFSARGNYFKKADIYHYVGIAVLPTMMSQVVSSAADLPTGAIVSNSLPIWLALTQFAPVYPSFLVPNNIAPPYIVAHIGETDTDALQPLPSYDYGLTFNSGVPGLLQIGIGAIGQTTQTFANPTDVPAAGFGNPVVWQLMRDKVRLTLYGFTNTLALSYRDYLLQYSINTDDFGICTDNPVLRDSKRTQRELGIIAQKKTLDMTVSYYQTAISTIAENLILSVAETFDIS